MPQDPQMPEPGAEAAETAQRAAVLGRIALIIACVALALSILGLFMPLKLGEP